MSKFTNYLFVGVIFFLLFFYSTTLFFNTTYAQTEDSLLRAVKDRIIDDSLKTVCYNEECSSTEQIHAYYYYNEDVLDKNILNSNTEKINDQTIKIHSGIKFYNNNIDGWHLVHYATTSIVNWFDIVEAPKVGFFRNLIRPYYVLAQTIFANASDGYFRKNHVTWGTVISGDADSVVDNTNPTNIQCQWSGSSDFQVEPSGYCFDTTILTATSTVATSSLFVTGSNISEDGGDTSVVVTDFTPADPESFVVADYDNWSTKASDIYVDASNIVGLNEWPLNAYGTSTIDDENYTCFMLHTDNVVDNDPCSNGHDETRLGFYSSEQTGTDDDPYLIITLLATTTEEEEAASSTPIGSAGMIYCADLSMECEYIEHYETSSTSPDWFEYRYHHNSYRIYWVIFSVTLLIFYVIRTEIVIRLRK